MKGPEWSWTLCDLLSSIFPFSALPPELTMSSGSDISPALERITSDEEDRSKPWCPELCAMVVRWDHETAVVSCPLCGDHHSHSVRFFRLKASGQPCKTKAGAYIYLGGRPGKTSIRVAPCAANKRCGRPLLYRILFPYDADERTSGLGWEKVLRQDGVGGSSTGFRTVGLRPGLVLQVNQTRREEDADIGRMASLLENTHLERQSDKARDGEAPETSICRFGCEAGTAHPVRDTRGCSLRGHLIAQGLHDEERFSIRSKGTAVDSPDENGRTPLMEAALWGRVSAVVRLLADGANASLRDLDGRTAADYAAEAPGNDKERSERHVSYSEDPHVKKAERAWVRALVAPQAFVDGRGTWPLNIAGSLSFYKSFEHSTISFFAPSGGTYIREQYKTAAVLRRGDPFPPCVSVSGWSTPYPDAPVQRGLEILDPEYWARRTIKIAEQLGFKFPGNYYDPEDEPGLYNASHAEAKLLSYYLDRHFPFEADDIGFQVDEEFVALCLAQRGRPRADIYVSQSPCASCESWREHVVATTGFSVEFKLADKVV